MKRVRSDHITTSVGQYLKRRHYADTLESSPMKKGVTDTQGSHLVEQVALQGAVAWEGTTANGVTYSSISGDAIMPDQHFSKFKAFVENASEQYQSDLQSLMLPICVHVFLELLNNGQKVAAQKFLSRNLNILKTSEGQKWLAEILPKLNDKEDINGTLIKEFKDNKFTVKISESTINYLLQFLKSEENVLLLQIFNNYIDIQVTGKDGHDETELAEDRRTEQLYPVSPDCSPENKVVRNESTLNLLQQSVRKVRDGPPCLTSIAFYTFLNTYQGMCSSTMSNDQSMLCGTFEDSRIKLWSLTPKLLHSEPPPGGVSVSDVGLHGDFLEDHVTKFKNLKDSECLSMLGHSGAVYGASFIPGKKFLVSASEDTTVRLWDLTTHQNVVCYRGHSYPVWGVDASATGFFVSCSHDRTAKLWNMERTFPLRTLVGHIHDVDCVKFHPNFSYVATGSSDKTVRLWSAQEGKPVRLFQGHRATVLSLAFSPNGQFLASAGEDRRVKVWDLGTGNLLKDLRGHTDSIYALSFNSDSTMLASGGLDCSLRVWDVRRTGGTGLPIEGHTSPELIGTFPTKSTSVQFLHFSPCSLLYGIGAFAT